MDMIHQLKSMLKVIKSNTKILEGKCSVFKPHISPTNFYLTFKTSKAKLGVDVTSPVRF